MAHNGMPVLVDNWGRSLSLSGDILVAGRAAASDIVLLDERASRRQFMLRRTPAGWEVRDLDSTNGTYVNGHRLRPNQAHILVPGDRLAVGSLSFTVQVAPSPISAASGPPVISRSLPADARRAPARLTTFPAWQGVVAALVVVGVALITAGAFQPWVRIDVQFTLGQVPGGQFLEDLLSAVEQAAGALLGAQPLIKSKTIVLGGMETFGELVLIAGALALLGLLADLGLKLNRFSLPGLIYILAALVPLALIYAEMQRFNSIANQEILFGVNLLTMLEGATRLLAPKVTPLAGLYAIGTGLAAVLLAGILRCLFPFLTRKDGI